MTTFLDKPLNFLKSGYSFLAGSVTGKPLIAGMPVSVSVELTNHCNLRCPECASGSDLMRRERGFMDIDLFRKLIGELRPYLYYINLYFQGESMLHPQFMSFPGIAGEVYSVVSTNGHFLNAGNSQKLIVSGLKKLIVSLDGMDQETYSKYRAGGDISRVISGIKNIADARSKYRSSLKLEIQFLVNKYNECQISDARRFAKEAGARLKLKSMQLINTQDIENWLPSVKRFRRYIKKGNTFIIRSSLPKRCMRLWFNPVITWDGKVLPCCFDKDAQFIMGDLNTESFKSIWNSKPYTDFRKLILTGRERIEICRNCTSGLKGVGW
jgi:radical SAM protein with 4Fe4S-binding SPASM domain